jgi:hypothetical protein
MGRDIKIICVSQNSIHITIIICYPSFGTFTCTPVRCWMRQGRRWQRCHTGVAGAVVWQRRNGGGIRRGGDAPKGQHRRRPRSLNQGGLRQRSRDGEQAQRDRVVAAAAAARKVRRRRRSGCGSWTLRQRSCCRRRQFRFSRLARPLNGNRLARGRRRGSEGGEFLRRVDAARGSRGVVGGGAFRGG